MVMDGPLTSMVMLLANRATSEKLRPPIAIALGIAIALCIAILTARSLVMCLLRRRDDNRQWGARPMRPLTDHQKALPIYLAGARQGESHAKFVKRVKKSFHNSKRTPKSHAKSNAKNNPKRTAEVIFKSNAKATKRLLVAQQTTHNNLLESTVPVQNVAWTDANPLDRDAAFASAFTKAVSLVETALRSNGGS